MSEFRITRSRDIELTVGGERLFGVTDFAASSVSEGYPIREYLSGEPVAVVSGKTDYELRLSVLSLFRYDVLEEDGFTLGVVDGDTAYYYDGCAVVGSKRSVRAGKNVVDEFIIRAAGMRKQVQEHAG